MITVSPIPAFSDNYIWAFRQDGATGVCIVDPGAAGPVLEYMSSQGLQLEAILITHHHNDHIGGVSELLKHREVPVYGPVSRRIPQITYEVKEGDTVTVAGITLSVLEVPGHTLEHIAYYSTSAVTKAGPVLFCGDTLFAGGCGRMFEGTPPMMHASLQKLAVLAADTQVFCAHEYTLSNLHFALATMPENDVLKKRMLDTKTMRANACPSVPSSIELERQTNPFLRCETAEILQSVHGHTGSQTVEPAVVFGILRRWKDDF